MSTHRVTPATASLDLAVNAGEDITFELLVLDDEATPVPLQSAVATIAIPRCAPRHEWTTTAGNLRLGTEVGQVFLDCTADETSAWDAWGDSEWQLDVVDVFGRELRPVEGDFRVSPSRRERP